MGITDLFSKRQRRARGEMPDVYTYDTIPPELRVQIIHIIQDAIDVGPLYRSHTDFHQIAPQLVEGIYQSINDTLCREYGFLDLPGSSRHRETKWNVLGYFQEVHLTERALDIIELFFKEIQPLENSDLLDFLKPKMNPEFAISELNVRFKEHGFGYQFESGEIIRVDSEFMHSEVVKPALGLLRGQDFAGANEEFLLAHEHYRYARHKECIADALKAFESTMKAICKIRNWPTDPKDTAKTLIAICFANELLPPYLESQMASLRSLLESGLPTVRNKKAGHGQGAEPVVVPESLARYALNLSATNILFLIEAHLDKA
jgi:AbiJ N-terminal domain 4